MSGSVGTAFVDLQPRFGAGFAAGLAGKLKGLVGPAAVVGIGAGLFSVGKKFEGLFNTIKVGTGASGGALTGLEKDAKAVLAGTAGSFDQVGTAIADLNTRTGLTGKGLQDLAKKEVTLARITKTDVGTNIAATTRVFGDWNIATDKQGEALDKLFRASQLTGSSVDALASGVVRFGAPLRQLGFSFEESVGLLGKFEKEGVNTNLVMGSMRIALGKLAKSGKEPVAAFKEQVAAIKAAGDAGKANSLALELFGARAGPDMAAAIREGRFDLGELFAQISAGGGSIDKTGAAVSTISGKLARLKNIALVALEPIGTKLVDLATNGVGKLVDAVVAAGPIISHGWAQITSGFTGGKLPAGASTVERFLFRVGGTTRNVRDEVARDWSAVITGLTGGNTSKLTGAAAVFAQFGAGARSAIRGVVAEARELGAKLAPALATAFDAVRNIDFRAIFGAAREALTGIVAAVRNIDFGAILGRLKAIVAPIIPPLLELGRAVTDLAVAAFPVLVKTGKDLVAFAIRLKPLWVTLAAGAYVLARAAGIVLGAALKIVAKATDLLAHHAGILRPILFALVAGFVALKVVRGVSAGILGAARAAGTAYGTFQRLATNARGAASALANNAKNALAAGRTILTLAVNIAKNTAAFVAQKVASLAAAAAQKAMTAAQWLLNAAMDANPIGLIVVGLTALVAGIVLAYQHFGPFRAVVDAVGRALATVAGVITGALGTAFGWVKAHWPLLLGILTGPFGLAVVLIARNWSKITAGARAAFGAITGFFRKLPEVILGTLGAAGTWLLNIGKKVIGGLVAGARAALGLYLRFYVELPLRILEKLAAAGTWLLGTGKKIIGGLLNGARSLVSHVWDIFTGLKGQILGKIGDASSWLLDVGKQIVEGLIKGIGSVGGKVLDTIKKLGGGVVGKALSVFGINSPSRVFAEIGGGLVEGLALGVKRDTHLGVKAVGKLATDVAGAGKGIALPPLTRAAAKPITTTPALTARASILGGKGFEKVLGADAAGTARYHSFVIKGLLRVTDLLAGIAKSIQGLTPPTSSSSSSSSTPTPAAHRTVDAKTRHDNEVKAVNAIANFWRFLGAHPAITKPKVVTAPKVDPKRYLGVYKPAPAAHVDRVVPAARAAAALLGIEQNAAGGKAPLLHQENHFHGSDKPTVAELDYAGRKAAFTVNNTGRTP